MKTLVVVLTIILSIVNSSDQKSTGRLRTRECDEMYAKTTSDIKYMLLYEGYVHDAPNIDGYCTVATNSLTMTKKFINNCLEPLNKQILNVFVKSLKKALRVLCKGEQEKKIALESLRCSTPAMMATWRNCLDQSNRQMDYVAKNTSLQDTWNDLCCVQVFHQECVETLEMAPGCENKKYNPKKLFNTIFEILMKDLSDIGCGKFRTKSDCNNNNANGMQRLTKVAASRRRVNSPLLLGPLLDLLPRLTE